MASVTLYSARLPGPEIIERGVAGTISCPVYRDGALVAPSSGTLSLYDRANVALLSAVSVTIASSIATYAVLAALTASLAPADGWRVEWALVMPDGVTHTFRRDAALVYRRLYPVVTDADLLRFHTDLTTRRPPSESSYQDYLDEAWAIIEGRLLATQRRPWLVLAPSALREVHLYTALGMVFRDFATGGPGTAEWERAADYDRRAEAAWASLSYPQAEESTGAARDLARRRAGRPTLWLAGRP